MLTRQDKEQHVKEIQDLISKSQSIIIWDYHGLTANQISGLRSEIKKGGSVNTVYKNRVAKIAFEAAGKKEILEHLTGPSSFLFTMDDSADSIKAILKLIKETEGKISFKAGYIDGEYHDANGVLEMATLPGKEDLLSMLLSVLQANVRNLAYSLSQVAESKPAGEEKAEEIKAPEVEDLKEEAKSEEPKAGESTKEIKDDNTTVEETTEIKEEPEVKKVEEEKGE